MVNKKAAPVKRPIFITLPDRSRRVFTWHVAIMNVRFAPQPVLRLIRHRGVCSEPLVITALAQRWSGLFSHSAANAVVQLKS